MTHTKERDSRHWERRPGNAVPVLETREQYGPRSGKTFLNKHNTFLDSCSTTQSS